MMMILRSSRCLVIWKKKTHGANFICTQCCKHQQASKNILRKFHSQPRKSPTPTHAYYTLTHILTQHTAYTVQLALLASVSVPSLYPHESSARQLPVNQPGMLSPPSWHLSCAISMVNNSSLFSVLMSSHRLLHLCESSIAHYFDMPTALCDSISGEEY